METKRQYTAPALKVVSFKVEQGFQSITYSVGVSTPEPAPESIYNGQNQERWGTDNNNIFGDRDWSW